MTKTIIGIMGPGSGASEKDTENAYEIGKFSAENGWIILTGGRNEGVMDAGLHGAKDGGGITIGILPSDDKATFSNFLDIPICTNMRSGRNYINVLSSNIVIACGMDHGTSSEVSLAIKPGKPVILLGTSKETNEFFKQLAPKQIFIAKNINEAKSKIITLVNDF